MLHAPGSSSILSSGECGNSQDGTARGGALRCVSSIADTCSSLSSVDSQQLSPQVTSHNFHLQQADCQASEVEATATCIKSSSTSLSNLVSYSAAPDLQSQRQILSLSYHNAPGVNSCPSAAELAGAKSAAPASVATANLAAVEELNCYKFAVKEKRKGDCSSDDSSIAASGVTPGEVGTLSCIEDCFCRKSGACSSSHEQNAYSPPDKAVNLSFVQADPSRERAVEDCLQLPRQSSCCLYSPVEDVALQSSLSVETVTAGGDAATSAAHELSEVIESGVSFFPATDGKFTCVHSFAEQQQDQAEERTQEVQQPMSDTCGSHHCQQTIFDEEKEGVVEESDTQTLSSWNCELDRKQHCCAEDGPGQLSVQHQTEGDVDFAQRNGVVDDVNVTQVLNKTDSNIHSKSSRASASCYGDSTSLENVSSQALYREVAQHQEHPQAPHGQFTPGRAESGHDLWQKQQREQNHGVSEACHFIHSTSDAAEQAYGVGAIGAAEREDCSSCAVSAEAAAAERFHQAREDAAAAGGGVINAATRCCSSIAHMGFAAAVSPSFRAAAVEEESNSARTPPDGYTAASVCEDVDGALRGRAAGFSAPPAQNSTALQADFDEAFFLGTDEASAEDVFFHKEIDLMKEASSSSAATCSDDVDDGEFEQHHHQQHTETEAVFASGGGAAAAESYNVLSDESEFLLEDLCVGGERSGQLSPYMAASHPVATVEELSVASAAQEQQQKQLLESSQSELHDDGQLLKTVVEKNCHKKVGKEGGEKRVAAALSSRSGLSVGSTSVDDCCCYTDTPSLVAPSTTTTTAALPASYNGGSCSCGGASSQASSQHEHQQQQQDEENQQHYYYRQEAQTPDFHCDDYVCGEQQQADEDVGEDFDRETCHSHFFAASSQNSSATATTSNRRSSGDTRSTSLLVASAMHAESEGLEPPPPSRRAEAAQKNSEAEDRENTCHQLQIVHANGEQQQIGARVAGRPHSSSRRGRSDRRRSRRNRIIGNGSNTTSSTGGGGAGIVVGGSGVNSTGVSMMKSSNSNNNTKSGNLVVSGFRGRSKGGGFPVFVSTTAGSVRKAATSGGAALQSSVSVGGAPADHACFVEHADEKKVVIPGCLAEDEVEGQSLRKADKNANGHQQLKDRQNIGVFETAALGGRTHKLPAAFVAARRSGKEDGAATGNKAPLPSPPPRVWQPYYHALPTQMQLFTQQQLALRSQQQLQQQRMMPPPSRVLQQQQQQIIPRIQHQHQHQHQQQMMQRAQQFQQQRLQQYQQQPLSLQASCGNGGISSRPTDVTTSTSSSNYVVRYGSGSNAHLHVPQQQQKQQHRTTLRSRGTLVGFREDDGSVDLVSSKRGVSTRRRRQRIEKSKEQNTNDVSTAAVVATAPRLPTSGAACVGGGENSIKNSLSRTSMSSNTQGVFFPTQRTAASSHHNTSSLSAKPTTVPFSKTKATVSLTAAVLLQFELDAKASWPCCSSHCSNSGQAALALPPPTSPPPSGPTAQADDDRQAEVVNAVVQETTESAFSLGLTTNNKTASSQKTATAVAAPAQQQVVTATAGGHHSGSCCSADTGSSGGVVVAGKVNLELEDSAAVPEQQEESFGPPKEFFQQLQQNEEEDPDHAFFWLVKQRAEEIRERGFGSSATAPKTRDDYCCCGEDEAAAVAAASSGGASCMPSSHRRRPAAFERAEGLVESTRHSCSAAAPAIPPLTTVVASAGGGVGQGSNVLMRGGKTGSFQGGGQLPRFGGMGGFGGNRGGAGGGGNATDHTSNCSSSDASSEESTKGTVNHRCRDEHACVNLCANPSDLWYGLTTSDGKPVVLYARTNKRHFTHKTRRQRRQQREQRRRHQSSARARLLMQQNLLQQQLQQQRQEEQLILQQSTAGSVAGTAGVTTPAVTVGSFPPSDASCVVGGVETTDERQQVHQMMTALEKKGPAAVSSSSSSMRERPSSVQHDESWNRPNFSLRGNQQQFQQPPPLPQQHNRGLLVPYACGSHGVQKVAQRTDKQQQYHSHHHRKFFHERKKRGRSSSSTASTAVALCSSSGVANPSTTAPGTGPKCPSRVIARAAVTPGVNSAFTSSSIANCSSAVCGSAAAGGGAMQQQQQQQQRPRRRHHHHHQHAKKTDKYGNTGSNSRRSNRSDRLVYMSNPKEMGAAGVLSAGASHAFVPTAPTGNAVLRGTTTPTTTTLRSSIPARTTTSSLPSLVKGGACSSSCVIPARTAAAAGESSSNSVSFGSGTTSCTQAHKGLCLDGPDVQKNDESSCGDLSLMRRSHRRARLDESGAFRPVPSSSSSSNPVAPVTMPPGMNTQQLQNRQQQQQHNGFKVPHPLPFFFRGRRSANNHAALNTACPTSTAAACGAPAARVTQMTNTKCVPCCGLQTHSKSHTNTRENSGDVSSAACNNKSAMHCGSNPATATQAVARPSILPAISPELSPPNTAAAVAAAEALTRGSSSESTVKGSAASCCSTSSSSSHVPFNSTVPSVETARPAAATGAAFQHVRGFAFGTSAGMDSRPLPSYSDLDNSRKNNNNNQHSGVDALAASPGLVSFKVCHQSCNSSSRKQQLLTAFDVGPNTSSSASTCRSLLATMTGERECGFPVDQEKQQYAIAPSCSSLSAPIQVGVVVERGTVGRPSSTVHYDSPFSPRPPVTTTAGGGDGNRKKAKHKHLSKKKSCSSHSTSNKWGGWSSARERVQWQLAKSRGMI